MTEQFEWSGVCVGLPATPRLICSPHGAGRAYALEAASAQGAEADAARAKARAAYNDFFTLWKDADPDIPILKEAKAEYAKLQ